MKKAWKIVLITAVCILIVGEIALGVGLLTGGSPDRIWDTMYQYYDFDTLFAIFDSGFVREILSVF